MADDVALILIGNELLSGKVRDLNCLHAIDDLCRIGGRLGAVLIVPDDIERIAEYVRECSQRYRWVVTSGGVGPTHDDMTAEGVALAFDVPLVEHPQLVAMIESHYAAQGKPVNQWVRKMARLPEGAEIVPDPNFPIPVVQMGNVLCLPGEPTLFKRKWQSIRARFQAQPLIQARVYTTLEEEDLAGMLAAIEQEEKVAIGSYPIYHKSDYRVMVTAESLDLAAVQGAFERLLRELPDESVVRTLEPRANG